MESWRITQLIFVRALSIWRRKFFIDCTAEAEHNGFAARIVGDEFVYIIIVPKGSKLEFYRKELYEQFDLFNTKSLKPYRIDISIGDCMNNTWDNMTIDDALRHADEKLYYEKSVRKQKSIVKNLNFKDFIGGEKYGTT
ncbi:MAG: diguanylate cyclase [Lachnospiraceae bacterium]|nr:diguanylate cyclase [Lachnospiraceae bacterium]